MSILNKVEEETKRLQDVIQGHISSINNIAATIEQLLANKANLQAEVHKLSGAIQAFAEVSSALKIDSPVVEIVEEVAEVISDVTAPEVSA